MAGLDPSAFVNQQPGLAVGNDAAPPAPAVGFPASQSVSIGGIMEVKSASALMQEELEKEKRDAQVANANPLVTSLAAYVRNCWTNARTAREQTIEPRFYQNVRARRGEYDPDILSKIRETGGSEIYMMLTSNKCRTAGSWLRDVLMGTRDDKPWTISPSPIPDLPADMMAELRQQAIQDLSNYIRLTGQQIGTYQTRQYIMDLREQFMNNLQEDARRICENMEAKMEDQLSDGGFHDALDQFLDDLCTFPTAFIKGPVVRRKPKMRWVSESGAGNATTPQEAMQGGDYQLTIEDQLVLEWERVDPFMMYPSAASQGINDGFLIERHKLRQHELDEMIGVEGYSDGAIRGVLEQYGHGGLQDWLLVDSAKAMAEGRSTTAIMSNEEKTIDALQFWGPVSGQMLRDWGLTAEEVPDTAKTYHCEVWLIGNWVIKATLNYHPYGWKPYYAASYERIPGSFWGNSVADLTRDCQMMCNAAARALANNMGIASGPQVMIMSDRVAPGEDVTQMYPWKIWQMTSDPLGSTAQPAVFFQPNDNSQSLMMIYDKFAMLADEYTGVPKYMTGNSPTGGAARTASGMSMLMSNANKSIKNVISVIDAGVFTPLLERLYFYNMKYSDDPQLKGDVEIRARGAAGIMEKEAAQVRRNEFLAATANPFDINIVGQEGRAALLRETAKTLDMDPDKIVPMASKRMLTQMIQQQLQQAQQAQMGGGAPGAPGLPSPQPPGGTPAAPAAPGAGGPGGPAGGGNPLQQTMQQGNPAMNRQMLLNSHHITDNFSPK